MKMIKINLILMKTIKNEFKPYHKVRGHCHYTGKFRGAAHNICNLSIYLFKYL